MTAIGIIWLTVSVLAAVVGLVWISIFEEPLRMKLGAGVAVIAAALTWPLVVIAAGLFRWAASKPPALRQQDEKTC